MDALTRQDLRNLLETREEPCISIYVPTFRKGPETQQNAIRAKNLLAETVDQLEGLGFDEREAAALLAPAYEILDDTLFWQYQSDGLAMFRTRDRFERYRVPIKVPALAVVADRFHVKPLLQLFTVGGRFYVLALSQKAVRLVECTPYSANEMDLRSVPQSLAEALHFEDVEKQLQYHTTVSGRRAQPAIFHGHGVGVDDTNANLREYFQDIDQGLKEMLHGERAPLVIASVEYLMPIYKEANTYPHLVDAGVTGNPELLSADELRERAWPLVAPLFSADEREAAARFEFAASRGLASSDLGVVMPAASDGRIETLFVAVDRQVWGHYDEQARTVHVHSEARPGDGDLLDLAAGLTLARDGAVFAESPDQVPGESALAAIFRY